MMLFFIYCFAAFLTLMLQRASADHEIPGIQAGVQIRSSHVYMDSYLGGVLVKNGTQTSCQLALLNSRTGFVAASCLDYIGNRVNKGTTYEVYVSNNSTSKPLRFTSEKIDVHPSYDPDTFANNVAIIQYNISSGMTWNLTLGVNVTEYADVYFIRRALKNLTTMEWYEPEVTSVKASDGQCSSWSNVFSNNKRDWMCNNRAVRSIYTEGCTVPYGTVYGAIDSKLTIAGIYSHSVVHGTDICGNSKQLHYYTMLASYFNWGKKVLGNVIRRGTKNRDIKVTVPADYAMRHPDSTTISGYSAIGGDLYFLQGVKSDSVPVMPDDSPSTTESDSLDFLGADLEIDFESALELIEEGIFAGGSEPVAPSESKSISRGEIIAIAVCVPAGLIIIFLAVFFGLKWRKRRQASRSWDPQLETENLRTVAMDIPGTTSVYADAPPRYESMHEHSSALAFPSAISEVTKGS